MEIPRATAYRADKVYADAAFYELEDHDGLFRRVRCRKPNHIAACYGDSLLGYFVRFSSSDLEDAQGKPRE